MSITFRSEEPTDHSAINELLGGVFGGEGEIKLIEDCRISEEFIRQLLNDFRAGKITEDEVTSKLTNLSFEAFDVATLDHHRELRHFAWVLYSSKRSSLVHLQQR